MNKWILLCIAAVVLMYIFLPDLFPGKKYKPDPALIHRIDSLEYANKNLAEQVLKYDSINAVLETKVQEFDTKISNIKQKTVVVKEYHNVKIIEAKKFTNNQVDSFFKNRYKY